MNETLLILLVAILSPLLGVAGYHYLSKKDKGVVSTKDKSLNEDEEIASQALKHRIVLEAKNKAKEIILEARDNALKIKNQAEKDVKKLTKSLEDKEKELAVKLTEIKVKEEEIVKREKEIDRLRKQIEEKSEKISAIEKERRAKLEKISGLTKDEAKAELMKIFDRDLGEEKSKRLRQFEEDLKKNRQAMAQEILVDAMRFGATDYVVQHTTSKVKLPDEDLKGRIIGKEGRNIRKFEELTGVELDLDSSPGEIIISCFDPIRREVAKVALERLLADGRIQPTRIEEIVKETEAEIDKIMYKEGDNLCHRVGVYNIHEDLVRLLGRFKYRFSYGQNMIEHTLEETRIGVAIAKELGADSEVVKLGCLFHDIGKVISDEEGTHVELGVNLLKKYKVDPRVIAAVAEHHEDKPFSSIESAIVALADHVSGARPGARSEDYEAYVERMKNLEDAAYSFDGVEKAYAISAGREVRVFVTPQVVSDNSAELLAKEIAKKIELEQTYPGVVKVTVIRETRYSDTAK